MKTPSTQEKELAQLQKIIGYHEGGSKSGLMPSGVNRPKETIEFLQQGSP
jgi:hypothetical protein